MFSQIIGQDQAAAILKQAVAEDRITGTYLFTGPEHVGKTAAALAVAQAVNCTGNRTDPADGCGECRSCRAIADGVHPDVRCAAPSGPSRTLRIPQFWPRDGVKDLPADRAILRDLHFGPAQSPKRFFIIEEAGALNDDTANSLLKVLEEPPSYAVFILTAPSETSVLPTIASRSQTVRFRRVSAAAIEAALAERSDLGAEYIHFLAAFSEGQIGTALRLASQPGMLNARTAMLDVASDLTAGSPPIQAYKIAEQLRKSADKLSIGKKDEQAESQRIALTHAFDILLLWYSDLLRVRAAGSASGLVNADRASQLAQHASHYTPSALRQAISLLMDTRRYIERNANAQIATEALALRLLALPRT